MKSDSIIILIIAALGGWYFFLRPKNVPSVAGNAPGKTAPAKKPAGSGSSSNAIIAASITAAPDIISSIADIFSSDDSE